MQVDSLTIQLLARKSEPSNAAPTIGVTATVSCGRFHLVVSQHCLIDALHNRRIICKCGSALCSAIGTARLPRLSRFSTSRELFTETSLLWHVNYGNMPDPPSVSQTCSMLKVVFFITAAWILPPILGGILRTLVRPPRRIQRADQMDLAVSEGVVWFKYNEMEGIDKQPRRNNWSRSTDPPEQSP
jgi:hypothetical protein